MMYRTVPKDDIEEGGEEEEEEFSHPSLIKDRLKAAIRSKLGVTVGTILLSLSAILFILLLYIISFHRFSSVAIETCGTSPAEAQSVGCIFDAMEFAWLPPRCFDKELQEKFLSLRAWRWYLDKEGTQDADKAKVLEGAYDELYATQEYHVFHCTYMWRKLHRAMLAGRASDGYISDIHHTAHCEMQITQLRDYNWNDTSTTVYTKYADCPMEQEDLGRMGWYRMIGGKKVYRNP